MRLKNLNWPVRQIILIMIQLLSVPVISGQNFTLKTYTTNEGLCHNNIRSIVIDSTGFLWAGTWDGLSRFDGHEFKNYFHIPGDSTSLPFFSVYNMTVDGHNNLWLMTDWGQLVRFDRSKDNFRLIRFLGSRYLSHIEGINTDASGNLIVMSSNEIIVWDENKGTGKSYLLEDREGKPYFPDWTVTFAEIYNDSVLWAGRDNALKFIKKNEGVFTLKAEYPILKVPEGRSMDYDFHEWYRFHISPAGNIWILSNKGLFRFDNQRKIFSPFSGSLPENDFPGTRPYCWGWYNKGIYIYYPSSGISRHIPAKTTLMPGSVAIGDSRSVWFTSITYSGVYRGLEQLIFTSGFFKNNLFSDRDSLAPAVYAITGDRDGNIWAGIRGDDHITQVTAKGEIRNIDELNPDLINQAFHIRCLRPVKEGIWIGYFSKLLQYYDYKTSEFKNYFPGPVSCRTILPENNGNIYIGTTDLYEFSPSTGKTKLIWKAEKPENMFKLYIDREGILWGTMSYSNLLRFDPRTGQDSVIHIKTDGCNIEDIIEGDNGDLWLAMLGEGVCRYNKSRGTFTFYTTASGLSNNTTYNLLKDLSGNIWVSTNNGISMINPSTGKIRIYGANDGLKISEFNSGAKYLSGRGEFFFGGMGGYVRFFPDSLAYAEIFTQKERILITNLKVSGGVKHLVKDLNESDTIVLKKGEDNFHLLFSTSDFINSSKTFYRYRLSGINENWIETGPDNRNINYSNLNPGWYTLEIEATDENGNWGTHKKLTIRLLPYFFQTRSFRIIAPLLVLGIVASFIIIYMRQVKQREKQIQDELKLQALSGQMNPHFIFNSLNSINYFISNNDKLSANRYIGDFARLIRSILANMGKNFIPFGDEISSLNDYLRIEHLRFGDKFDYKVETSGIDDIPGTYVHPGLVQPFVENAIWHGVRALEDRKGFIRISFEKDGNDRILCMITDDGIGREKAMKISNDLNHRSKGIEIVKERLLITGKLTGTTYRLEITDLYNDRKESGTRVRVDIPVRPVRKDKI